MLGSEKNEGTELKKLFEEARRNGTEDELAKKFATSLKNGEKITVGYAYSGVWMPKKEEAVKRKDQQRGGEERQYPWLAKLKVNEWSPDRIPHAFTGEKSSLEGFSLNKTGKPNRIEYLPSKLKKKIPDFLEQVDKEREELKEKRNEEFEEHWKEEERKFEEGQDIRYGIKSLSSGQKYSKKLIFYREKDYTWNYVMAIFPISFFCIPKVKGAIYNSSVSFFDDGQTNLLNALTERNEELKSENRQVMAKFLPLAKSIIKRGGRYFLLTTKGWEEMEQPLQDQLKNFEYPKEGEEEHNLTTLKMNDRGIIHHYLLVKAHFLALINFGEDGDINYGFIKKGRFSFTKKDDELLKTYLRLANIDCDPEMLPQEDSAQKNKDRYEEEEDFYGEEEEGSSSSEESA